MLDPYEEIRLRGHRAQIDPTGGRKGPNRLGASPEARLILSARRASDAIAWEKLVRCLNVHLLVAERWLAFPPPVAEAPSAADMHDFDDEHTHTPTSDQAGDDEGADADAPPAARAEQAGALRRAKRGPGHGHRRGEDKGENAGGGDSGGASADAWAADEQLATTKEDAAVASEQPATTLKDILGPPTALENTQNEGEKVTALIEAPMEAPSPTTWPKFIETFADENPNISHLANFHDKQHMESFAEDALVIGNDPEFQHKKVVWGCMWGCVDQLESNLKRAITDLNKNITLVDKAIKRKHSMGMLLQSAEEQGALAQAITCPRDRRFLRGSRGRRVDV